VKSSKEEIIFMSKNKYVNFLSLSLFESFSVDTLNLFGVTKIDKRVE